MNLEEKVFLNVKKIPKGKVITYKELAHSVGIRAYRLIGKILQKNPSSYLVKGNIPCHRIIKSDGTIGGFFGEISGESIQIKKELLESEGIRFDENNKIIGFDKVLHKF
ncbi:cysteine methyltransferase [Candidatus Woesearchaeota archaeon]|nr:MAG: cysteine methyltransferase [Candidatus Woesearchaeota archaeon]